MKEERVLYPDAIRTLACIFVVILHISGSSSWYTLNVEEKSWAILMLYNACVRSAVPLFVMISGIFLLEPSKQCGTIYIGKKIMHLLKIYIIWSFFYGVVWAIEHYHIFYDQKIEDILKKIGSYIFESKFHLWFLPMLIGVYFIVPCLRKIAESKKITEYFLILFFCFNILRGSLLSIIKSNSICSLINRIPMEFIMGFVGYLMLGYYVGKWGINKKVQILCNVIAIVTVLISCVASVYLSRKQGTPGGVWTDEFSISSFFAAVAVFAFFKEKFQNGKKGFWVWFIKFTAKYSLGIYLIHVFWIELLEKIGVTVVLFDTILSVPMLSLVVFLLSLWTCYLLEKIKIVQRIVF